MPSLNNAAVLGAYLFVAILCGISSLLLSQSLASLSSSQAPLSQIALAAVGVLALVPLCFLRRIPGRDWFHPFAFPFIYMTAALFAPILYLAAFRRPLASLVPSAITAPLTMVLILTVGGMAIGLATGMVLTRRRRSLHNRTISYRQMLLFGRILIVVAIIARAYSSLSAWGSPYAEGVVSFGLANFLDNLASSSLFAGTILVVLSNAHHRSRIAGSFDVVAFLLFVFITLATGSRGELIAPILFAVFAHHTFIRRIPLAPAMIMVLTVAFVFQGIAGLRSDSGFYGGGLPAAERVLTSVGSPIYVTSQLMDVVPSRSPHTYGSTYIAAVQRQLPGPLAVAIFGPPSDTGSYVFRELVGFDSVNAGYSFSLPSEGYLNFGKVGAFSAALFVGLVMGYAFRKQVATPSRALHLLYPVIVATLPLSLRSDALTQLKTVLYPMIILAICYRWLTVSHTATLSLDAS